MVLMDIQMPEMDGFEATKIIHDSQSKVCDHAIPTFAMTAHNLKGDKDRCLTAGMDILNPITLEAHIACFKALNGCGKHN